VKTLALLTAYVLGLGTNLFGQTAARFESGPAQVSLLELYTSEGCSSCPPAEAWLSALYQSADLWRSVVPVAFHIDYWDNLGWRDPFSNREFTARQRRYAASWGADSIYTPDFVLNGNEWRAWGRNVPVNESLQAGKLEVAITAGELKINYSPPSHGGAYAAAVVPLKMNATSHVTRGENEGRNLVHQFIAMNLIRADLNQSGNIFTADVPCPTDKADALAVWITRSGSLVPVQAAGGFLR
jgi:hypothetical protein